jgi:ABC-type transporter Mla MlaB component
MSTSLPHPLALSGDLSLRAIGALHAELKQAVAEHPAIAIDTSAVESADVAGLQLLVAAARTAAAAGHTLTLNAAQGSPMARVLIAAGFFTPDGRALVPSLSSWTITREAA